ncbi:MAG: hypothetical protein COC12_08400 [Rhodobacteraceae bacterium]|nr:MAG: hypothetical protein COC12_08400 [Paracoccaceae bacterium]
MAVKRIFKSLFQPGDQVVVGGEISGIVERVCFARNMTCPMILVEWWDRSEVNTRYFHEDEVHHSDEETGNG